MFQKAILLFSFLTGLTCPNSQASFPSNKWQFDWGGNFKSIVAVQNLRQENIFPHDTVPLLEQRLRFQKTISKNWFYFEFANETSFFIQRSNPPFVAIPSYESESAWKARWHLIDEDAVDLFHKIDRSFVQASFDPVELRVGKQIVSSGVGRIFAAVSQVPRLPFVVVDPEYPMTEDAATLTWKGPLALEIRFLPKLSSQKDQNLQLRAKGSKGGFDVALTSGRSDDKAFVALESAGNVGESLLRAELTGYDDKRRGVIQWLVGFDHVFSSTLSADLEIYYNGFGKEPPYRFQAPTHRSTPYLGLYYVGTTLKWDITDRLHGQLNAIMNILDPSSLLHLFLSYSLSTNSELKLGQFIGVGGPNSEFAGKLPVDSLNTLKIGLPDLSYLVVKWYF